jgi:hypothetical protein
MLGAGLIWLGGCTSKDTGSTPPAPSPGKSGGSKKTSAAKVAGYATLKGKVTYNGEPADMKVAKIKPTKDADKCPAEIDGAGWYVKDASTKGVRYAVVFLKAPSGMKMPKDEDGKVKAAAPLVELRQPKCQFEPRVLSMHPAQKLKAFNDSEIVHDTNLAGPKAYTKAMPPGSTLELDPDTSNSEPYKVACGIHTGMMVGYVWRFDHPWSATSDEAGAFEIKMVPVLESGALDVWVWHEMLPENQMKKVGSITVKDGETQTLDIAIPK